MGRTNRLKILILFLFLKDWPGGLKVLEYRRSMNLSITHFYFLNILTGKLLLMKDFHHKVSVEQQICSMPDLTSAFSWLCPLPFGGCLISMADDNFSFFVCFVQSWCSLWFSALRINHKGHNVFHNGHKDFLDSPPGVRCYGASRSVIHFPFSRRYCIRSCNRCSLPCQNSNWKGFIR